MFYPFRIHKCMCALPSPLLPVSLVPILSYHPIALLPTHYPVIPVVLPASDGLHLSRLAESQ